jgi:hypothetical protein
MHIARFFRWGILAMVATAAFALTSCASSGSGGGSSDEIGIDPAAARALSGTWVFHMETGDHETDGKLRFTFDGFSVSGAFIGQDDEEKHLSNIQVAGGKVSWEMDGPRGTSRALGKTDQDTMKGTLKPLPKDSDSSGGSGGSGSGGGSGGYGGGRGGGRHSHGGGSHGNATRSTSWTATRSRADK